MEIIQSVVLGFMQGASEFLPISSSGHLIIAPWLFNWKDPGLAFDVALHFGTLIAVVTYFWKDWVIIFRFAFAEKRNTQPRKATPQGRHATRNITNNFLWIIIVATIPGVLAGLFLENLAETVFRHPLLIAFK